VRQRREIPQLQIVLARDVIRCANRSEHLRLLDGIDTKIRFQVQIEIQHIGRIARLLGNDPENGVPDVVALDRRGVGRSRSGSRVRRCRRWLCVNRLRNCRDSRRPQVRTAVIDKLDRMRQRREIPQFQIVLARDVIRCANRSEHFRLLNRIDAKIRFKIQIEIQHIRGIAGLLGNDFHNLGLHRIHGANCGNRCGNRCGSRSGGNRCGNRRGRGRGGGRRNRLQSNCAVAIFICLCRALIFRSQGPLHNLKLRTVISGKTLQPVVPCSRVLNSIAEAERIRRGTATVGRRNPAQQRHTDLRSESRAETQRVADWMRAALGKIQIAQLRIHLLEIRDRRNNTGFQDFCGDDILNADGHRMSCSALGVGNKDLVRGFFENVAQGKHLCGRTATAGRCVGFVGHEDGLGGNLEAIEAPVPLHIRNQLFHHMTNVRDVEPGSMEGAVCDNGSQNLADRPDAALTRRFRGLQNERRSAHPDDEPMAPPIKRRRLFLDNLARRGRTGGQEAGSEPAHQVVGGDVIRRNHDHAAAAARPNPVTGQRQSLCAAGAGRVRSRIRSSGAYIFGKLRVAHGEHTEEEPSIKMVDVLFDFLAQYSHAPFDLFGKAVAGTGAPGKGRQAFQFPQTLAADTVPVEAGDDFLVGIISRERGGKENSGVIPNFVGQHPAIGELCPFRGRLIAHDQRDTGVAQCVDTGANRQLGHAVESRQAVGGEAEIADEVKFLRAGGQLDDIVHAFDGFEAALAALRFHQPGDILLDHLLAQVHRDRPDKHIAAQHAFHV